jgi:NADH dehydrogenase
MTSSPSIAIVGGGIAGLEIATELGRQLGRSGRATITLIDRDTAHIFKPMLHTIAAGTSDVHREQVAFASHAWRHGFTYWPGEMDGIDRQRKAISLAPLPLPDGRLLLQPRSITYDALILAVGSQANDFGTPGVAEHCHFIDSRLQADAFSREARAQMLRCVTEDASMRIAIVGGGATGVELAAELVQLAESAAAYGDSDLASRVGLTLIESGPRLLSTFPERISTAAEHQLRALGVDVRTGTRVSAAEPGAYRLSDGSLVEATLMVWAAGVKGADVLSSLDGLDATRSNQLLVRPTLQTLKDDHIFAVGDCASLTLPGSERPLPPTAQVAHQQAKHLARHLPAWLEGSPLPAFSYRDFGSLVSLGRYNAFGSLGRFGLFRGGFIRGRFAQLSHIMLYRSHQARLHGFWRGSLLWLADRIDKLVRPSIRLD